MAVRRSRGVYSRDVEPESKRLVSSYHLESLITLPTLAGFDVARGPIVVSDFNATALAPPLPAGFKPFSGSFEAHFKVFCQNYQYRGRNRPRVGRV